MAKKGTNGGNRKLARAEKRKRYYARHPEKSPEAKRQAIIKER